ncbi:MAG: hypothetical protein HZB63_05540 [Deltaproteobacteria bacterium]|nr:hypothetical protein [Deltaproteobacteria bacterium]
MSIEPRRTASAVALIVLLAAGEAPAHHPSAGFGTGSAGPITTISAVPVPRKQWSFDLRGDYLKFDRISNGRLEELAAAGMEVHSIDDERTVFFGAGYGLTEDFSLGFHIPYVVRRGIREGHMMEDGTPEVHVHGDSEGIGDLSLFGMYRFARQEKAGADLSLLFGLKMPTGTTREKDLSGARFATEFQPGSGSWDPLVGLSATRRWGPASLDASLLYAIATKGAQGTDLGDMLHYGAAISCRFVPGRHDSHDASPAQERKHAALHRHIAWDFILEATGDWKRKQTVQGIGDDNSGGTTIFLSPGVRFNYQDRWSAYLSTGFPILQDMNGTQHDVSYRILLGISAGL